MKRTFTGLMLLALVAPLWAMEPVPTSPPPKPLPAGAETARSNAAAKEAATLEPAVQTSPPGAKPAQDRLELDATQITGNRELPRVLYVVPWKRPDLGDLAGRPANSLLDEVLAPVDRDVFRRQNRYYQALKPDSAGGVKGNRSEGEK
ncbi:MAG: hypothetical protein ABI645_16900 [Pseudomonadota bacterium]